MKTVVEIGAKGGRSTLARHGRLYFSRLVKKRWNKRKKLKAKRKQKNGKKINKLGR